MPKALVAVMECLFGEKELRSWRITSGEMYTQVTLRFSPDQYGNQDTEPKRIKYKRVAPSQLKRDSLRAERRNTVYCEDRVDIAVDTNKVTELKDVSTIENKSADDNLQYQPSSTEHNAPLKPMHMQTEVINNTDSDLNDEHNVPSSGEDNSSASTDSVDSKSDVNCDICDDIVNTDANSSYYVCALCTDPSGVFCVCENCYKNDKHDDHKMQMTKLTEPAVKHGFYCSQCGYVFRSSNTSLYVCAYCREIEYELCKKCYDSGLHSQHKDCFQKLTRKDLEAQDFAFKLKPVMGVLR